MINIPDGKCPSCSKVVNRLTIDPVTASMGYGQLEWNAVTYCCPHCKVVLGAGIDPVALKNDTIDGILQGLKGKDEGSTLHSPFFNHQK